VLDSTLQAQLDFSPASGNIQHGLLKTNDCSGIEVIEAKHWSARGRRRQQVYGIVTDGKIRESMLFPGNALTLLIE
jgi:hypothetical protein